MIAVKDYHDTKYDESLSSLKMIPTPSETQQLFLQTYSIEPYMMAYFNHDDPHRACKLAPNDSNAQNDLENELNAVLQRVLAKLAKKRNKNNVTPVSESSKRTSPSAWQTLTDSEREELQRERRKRNAYKTSLCRSFRDSKTCPYGEECVFAHGEEELRLPPQAHPKYKTQLCNKFSVWNYCPYGARCQYIHQRVNEISKIDANTMKENSNENAKMNFSLSSLKKPSKHLRAMNKKYLFAV
uniref:C3H1-type domain-containing protein n=1 Tax=Setaria digitata TaxID=48799 RepID=A0A915PWR5_9BILA